MLPTKLFTFALSLFLSPKADTYKHKFLVHDLLPCLPFIQMAQLASYYGAIRDTVSRFDARGFEARCEAPRSSSSPYLPLASASIGLSRRIGERCRASRKLASSKLIFYTQRNLRDEGVDISANELSASLQVRVPRFLYRRLHARKNMYTHAHIHSVIFCSLYIVCISLRFPRISELVSIISLQASINRLLHSENRLLLFLSLSLSTSESPLDRVQTQSLQARASRRFSLFDYIGLYHDPLGYYLLYRRDTCIHAHTYTHIHYFIESLVLSFMYSFAPSLCIV